MTEVAKRLTAPERQALALAAVRDQSLTILGVVLENVGRLTNEHHDDADFQLRVLNALAKMLPAESNVTVQAAAPDLGRVGAVQGVEKLLALARANEARLLGERALDVEDAVLVEEYDDLL